MWNILQCAVQGTSHIKTQTPCQDKTYFAETDAVRTAALADGAGSAEFSHFGAEAATKFICSELCNNFDDYFSNNDGVQVKQDLVSKLIARLTELSQELNCHTKDLASTLLFIAVKDDKYILGHIGDGVIGYLKNGELKVASQPENGEFVNTTVFVTSKDAVPSMKLIKGQLGQIRGFVLMSDGTEAGLYNRREKKLADVIKKIMEMSIIIERKELEKLIEQSFENVVKKVTSDDCSIAILMDDYDEFKGFSKLSKHKKCELLDIGAPAPKRQLKQYDNILECLNDTCTIKTLARKLHAKPKYLKLKLKKLSDLNFIKKSNCSYKTIIKMD